MKLDLAVSGKAGWKTVIEFPEENLATVRAAVRSLIKASSNEKLAFRVLDDAGALHSDIDKAIATAFTWMEQK